MAGTTLDRLLESFVEASGGEARSPSPGGIAPSGPEDKSAATVQTPGGTLGDAATAAADIYGSSANPAGSNVYGTPASSSQNSGGGGSTAGSMAATFFESGFGMADLVRGLVGLFSGGSSAPAPLQKYEMPSAIDFESVETASGLSGADYDQSGTPRTVGLGQGDGTGAPAGGSVAGSGPQITVNVQAMDAQSFMDHSDAIAQAVRGAMLNSSSINDVVNEL